MQRWHGGAHGSLVAKGVALRYCRVKLRVSGLRDLGLKICWAEVHALVCSQIHEGLGLKPTQRTHVYINRNMYLENSVFVFCLYVYSYSNTYLY